MFSIAPLAWACRVAGHEVRVASQPELTPMTVGAGLAAVEVGHAYHFREEALRFRGGHRYTSERVAGLSIEEKRKLGDDRLKSLATMAEATAPGLLGFAERWQPHLVVTDPVIFAAPLVAALLGIPLVRHLWGPDIWIRVSHPMQGKPADAGGPDRWPAELVALYRRFGVPVRNDYVAGTVDPWPGSLQFPGSPGRIPMRFVPYNGAAVAPDWVLDRPSRRRVCVTWGTSTTTLGGENILPRIVEALASLDVEVVLAVGRADVEKLGELPGNAWVAENLPLHLLMPSCGAIVNQGGAGTLLTAACYGVPQVLLPQTAETPFNAASFGASGASVTLQVADATIEAIAGAVTAALTDEAIRSAAGKVRDEIAVTPPPSDVVRTLENLASL